jgi:hypothetical protein
MDRAGGWHEAVWNTPAASGVYFYRIEAKGADGTQFTSSRKLMLLK